MFTVATTLLEGTAVTLCDGAPVVGSGGWVRQAVVSATESSRPASGRRKAGRVWREIFTGGELCMVPGGLPTAVAAG